MLATAVEKGKADSKRSRYVEGLGTDNGKHIVKLGKVLKLLEQMCTGKAVNDEELPKLVDMVEGLATEHSEIVDWAAKFGFDVGAKPAKKSRKGSGTK